MLLPASPLHSVLTNSNGSFIGLSQFGREQPMVDYEEGEGQCLGEEGFVYPAFMDEDEHLVISMIFLAIKSQFVKEPQ